MTSLQKNVASLIGGAVVAAFLVLVFTPKPHNHNLEFVSCENASILVNPSTGTDKDNELVFLCKGQTATWIAPSGTGSYTINFADPTLFGGPSFTSNSSGQIGPLTVAINPPAGSRAKAFKYQLTISGVNPFDPHVIIM